MDIADEDIINLWKILHKHGVKYIMVGGFATNLHGFNRTTADIDVWLKDEKENRHNFRKALDELQIGNFEALETTQLVPGWSTIYLTAGFELDVMTYISGFETDKFDECYQMAPEAIIEETPVRFLHINHLIASKQASNREKDKLDITELNIIKKQNNQ